MARRVETRALPRHWALPINTMSAVALFDYSVSPENAIGKCNLRVAEALCSTQDVTVFSSRFSNSNQARIRWVRVPAPRRPLALLFVTYHLLAPVFYLLERLRHGLRFRHVQMVESNLSFGDVCYSHFCHRAFLRYYWKESRPPGLRRFFRWLDHRLHAFMEPWVYRRVKHVVVPSLGLARELTGEYPYTRNKIHVIPNPVDLEAMRRPANFGREEFRAGLGFSPDNLVLVFIALGAYERKGLPLLLEGLKQFRASPLKLLVVGGPYDLIAEYRSRVARMTLARQVLLVGTQPDVRPYLWAADAFALPSFYETFSLVALEAAAAGLPILVSQLSGVEEFLRDDENGILVDRTPEGVAEGIRKFLAMSPETRRAMGEHARQDVQRYSAESFVAAWRAFYESLNVG